MALDQAYFCPPHCRAMRSITVKGAKRENPTRSSWESTDFAVRFLVVVVTMFSGMWIRKMRRAAMPPIGRLM